jgi:hypothetical protein
MRKGQSGIASIRRATRARSVSSGEDSDREWLSSLFDAFDRSERDLDTLVAQRTRRMAKAREAGLSTRIRRSIVSAISPGRRMEDLFQGFGRMDPEALK